MKERLYQLTQVFIREQALDRTVTQASSPVYSCFIGRDIFQTMYVRRPGLIDVSQIFPIVSKRGPVGKELDVFICNSL